MLPRFALVTGVLLVTGCSEFSLTNKPGNDAGAVPDILVDPPALEFGELSSNDTEVQQFTVENIGDADLHVLLEEVDGRGGVHYVTEGVQRASLRRTSQAPYDNLGLPYQACRSTDVEPLPDETPAEVVLDLHPTANVFNAGHRLRLTVMGADKDNTEPSPVLAETVLVLHRGAEHPSRLELPVRP